MTARGKLQGASDGHGRGETHRHSPASPRTRWILLIAGLLIVCFGAARCGFLCFRLRETAFLGFASILEPTAHHGIRLA